MEKPPTFEELLASARHSAIHLEMRDGYMESDPDYVSWREGHRPKDLTADPDFQNWLTWVREASDRGVAIRRARVFSVPESNYIRFEHYYSDANVEAGEQIRWLPRRQATDIAFPGNDFWVFDNDLVLVLHFTGDGESAEDWMELTKDPKIRDLCVSAFEAVWERAIPHAEYKITS
ncbi:DUF6879 family protein [Streptomyces jumonjinensis]|uniref:DUF6879 domain-containing protein n=1 Tax=Streptomyces jumonjinensis TaxID=1945 RepID=A0A646KEY9_STRJU|nr:DUF6879 family protein [Streptomyces jumonjinensis]MQT00620.1 hypothetical protein [Streptomyces jumonjinensis]